MNSLLNLPDGASGVLQGTQLSLKNSYCEINSAHQKMFGASWNDVWLVITASFSLPEWLAVKMTFFAPWEGCSPDHGSFSYLVHFCYLNRVCFFLGVTCRFPERNVNYSPMCTRHLVHLEIQTNHPLLTWRDTGVYQCLFSSWCSLLHHWEFLHNPASSSSWQKVKQEFQSTIYVVAQ